MTDKSQSADERKKADVRHLRSLVGAGLDQNAWETAWQRGVTPWDSGGVVQPSLAGFVKKTQVGQEIIVGGASGGKVLVPGCGKGCDVEFFASLGYKSAVGIDIAPGATQAAQEWLDSLQPRPAHHQHVKFQTADFFEDPENQLTGYTLAYDYTFFCAIPPTLRPKWAEAYARSVVPGGHLLTLVFPIDGDRADGPPYSVSPAVIASHLEPFFELVWQGVPPDQPERRKGMEEVMLWKRRRA
ncbi:unnamed protein product [Parajaminaea phylloscopi]